MAGAPHITGVELNEVIGRGASSIVYRGRQVRFNRAVAVKVLDLAGQPELVGRLFLNECRVVGRLASHPNIVTVLDGDLDEDGRPYLVMEYLPGGSLADAVATGGPLPVDRVIRHAVELAGALESAHRNGVIHGDVKPQNVLVGRSGQAVLGDFGIARLGTGVSSRSLSVFTPLHAAPELFDGEAVTSAADVYGLASTMFELLDGRPAVGESGESPLVIVRRVARDERRLLERSDLPPGLADLVHRAMSTDPADRPASAVEFGEELRAMEVDAGHEPTSLVVLDEVPVEEDVPPVREVVTTAAAAEQTLPPPTVPRRPGVARAVTTVAVLAGVALLAVVAVLLVRNDRSEPLPEEAVGASEPAVTPTSATPGRIPSGAAGPVTPTTAFDLTEDGEVPTRENSGGGPLPGLSFDVPGVADRSSVLLAELGDGSEVLAPFGPDASVVNVAAPVLPQLPARGRWRAFNATDNPECPGFDTPEIVVSGVWDKLAVWPGGQGGARVLEFGSAADARWLFNAWSMEQGAGTGECSGFAAPFGVADPAVAEVVHQDTPIDLGPEVRVNTWLQPPPAGSPEFRSVRTFLAQSGPFLVGGAVGEQSGPVAVDRVRAVVTNALDRLR